MASSRVSAFAAFGACSLTLAAPAVARQAPTPSAAPGFALAEVAAGLPASIRDVAVAPSTFGGFGGHVFVADWGDLVTIGDGQILRVDPAGFASVFLGSTLLTPDPHFLAFGPGGVFGSLLYTSSNESPAYPNAGVVSVVSPSGFDGLFGNPTPPGYLYGGVDVAFAAGGAFGTYAYTGTSSGVPGDCVSRIPAGGGAASLFANIGSGQFNGTPLGLAFGPGTSGWNSDLYVAIRSLNPSVLASGVYRYDGAGVASPFVTSATHPLLSSPYGLAFGTGGGFGTDLYVTNVAPAGAVLRVSSPGGVTPFVTGLTSAVGLDFEGAAALYFDDPSAGRLYRVEPCLVPASASSYGTGWPGTNGVPPLTASGPPQLGTTLGVTIGNSSGAPTVALLLFGFTQVATPTPFGGTLLVSPDFVFLQPLSATGSTPQFEIPAALFVCGTAINLQVVELDSGASHGFSFTSALALILGG